LADPQLVVCGDSGVGIFPFKAEVLEGLMPTDKVSAEPALLALASQIFQRSVTPLSPAEHQLQVIASAWDLSQRLQMRSLANRGKLAWLQAPRWRFARWAAVVLLGVNVIGLNALAWLDQHQLAVKQETMKAMLTRSFPSLTTIVDVPLQMAREVRLLEKAHAAPAAADLDVMLGALSRTLPAGQSLKGLDYANGQLRLTGLELTDKEASALSVSLKAHGYSITRDGVNWLLQSTAETRGKR
jgi:general secretion pathway protein L